MWTKLVSTLLILAVIVAAFGTVFLYLGLCTNGDMYVVDKGLALSYVDEYGFTHDTVYWLVVADNEQRFTVFTTGKTWHMYAVGELYAGTMERFIVYEGDDSIARYLGDTPSPTPTPVIDKNYATP